ncbi:MULTISPECIES: LexA family transcriptional regulator [Larkinella]|uniref:LexA family transcriptional regulator n=1 Tax=Larkinella TaxID=332157 RepID=UPI0014875E2C|nr:MULTISPECIES: LexA family transcriptional regulator [Larkinella]
MRQYRGLSQREVASTLGISRPSLISYEKGAMPTIDTAGTLSKFYNVTVDALLYENLGNLSATQLDHLFKSGNTNLFGQAQQIHEVVRTVGEDNEENVEFVPVTAIMGYCSGGYNDIDFIAELPRFRLPFLSKSRKYRMFPTKGDSMLPIPSGSYVVGEYIEKWGTIKDGSGVIVISKEGIVLKKVVNELSTNGRLILHSLNPSYESYEMAHDDILQLWKYDSYISREFPDPEPSLGTLLSEMRRLSEGMIDLQRGQGKLLESVQK